MNEYKLTIQMLQAAKWRGHNMRLIFADCNKSQTREVALWRCVDCNKEGFIDTNPPPNGIDISGEAVALNCEGE